MKLDRNLNGDGTGKYALLLLRNLPYQNDTFGTLEPNVESALRTLEKYGILDWGDKPETEFFLMRLKDKYARDGLLGYSGAARADGQTEWAEEVDGLASRAGPNNPHCKMPD